MSKIPVLDHGFVRLVASMGNDLSVVRSARVSYDAAWRSGLDEGSDHRLIHYLMKNHHTSPFESVEFQFEVKAPIFVLRQWHRHRTWSFNELSARYRELPEEFYVPEVSQIGVQSTSNKQGREISTDPTLEKRRLEDLEHYEETCTIAFIQYHDLLAQGWPRELARCVLPLATYSHMFAKVDLKNFLDFLTLRLHPHAQFEIRAYAEAMLSLVSPIVPTTILAWQDLINMGNH